MEEEKHTKSARTVDVRPIFEPGTSPIQATLLSIVSLFPFFDHKDIYKLKNLTICIAFTKTKNIKPASAHATHPEVLSPLPHGMFAARTPTKPI
jgi:hypothetical protein